MNNESVQKIRLAQQYCDNQKIGEHPLVCCSIEANNSNDLAINVQSYLDPPLGRFALPDEQLLNAEKTCVDPNGVPGNCTNINECKTILNDLQSRLQDESYRNYIRISNGICNKNEDIDNRFERIVCCPTRENGTSTSTSLPQQSRSQPAPQPTPIIAQLQRQTVIPMQSSPSCIDPNGEVGKCINIRNCSAIVGEISKSKVIHEEFKSYILESKSICNRLVENNIQDVHHVCCPSRETAQLRLLDDIDGSNTYEFPFLLPETGCGYSNISHGRIIGGEPAEFGAWPWIALLGYTKSMGMIDFRCGGSLISNRHVLTAAHCVTQSLYVSDMNDI